MTISAEFDLSPQFLRAAYRVSIEVPVPDRQEAIPFALTSGDLTAIALTASDKTAAFFLSMVERRRARRLARLHRSQSAVVGSSQMFCR
jgi:superfamily II DNA/RNA helicase